MTKELRDHLLPTNTPEEETPFLAPKKNRPIYAASCMLIAVMFYANNLLLIKVLTLLEPGISPFLLLAIRSTTVLIIFTPFIRVYLKQPLSESLLEPFRLFELATYVVSFVGTIYEIMICYVCLGELPIVNVSIFINMAPLFTVILAVPILKERLTVFNGV